MGKGTYHTPSIQDRENRRAGASQFAFPTAPY